MTDRDHSDHPGLMNATLRLGWFTALKLSTGPSAATDTDHIVRVDHQLDTAQPGSVMTSRDRHQCHVTGP